MREKTLSFELAGVRFRGAHLDPTVSLECLTLIAPAIGGVLDSVKVDGDKDPLGAVTNAIRGALLQFDALPKTVKFFEPSYDVLVNHGEGEVWLPLSTRKAEVFEGKGLLFAGFLIAAITQEYIGFLREGGLSMLADLASLYGFKMTSPSNGKSGDS